MRYVLSNIDESGTACDVVRSINILIALRWMARDADLDVTSCELEEEDDPFLEADMHAYRSAEPH